MTEAILWLVVNVHCNSDKNFEDSEQSRPSFLCIFTWIWQVHFNDIFVEIVANVPHYCVMRSFAIWQLRAEPPES